MENKNLKVVVYVLTGMVGFGLGLIAISLFMSFMDLNIDTALVGTIDGFTDGTFVLKLFESEDWTMLDLSPAFVIISYLVLIAGLIIVAADASVKQKLKKKIKGLNFAGLAVTVVGFALLVVSIIITKGDAEYSMNQVMLNEIKSSGETAGMTDKQIMAILEMIMGYSLGIGSVMAIIGGVIALIGSILIVIPAFDPIKLAEEPAANTAAQAPTTPVAEQPAAPTTPEAPTTTAEPAQNTEANDNHDTIA